MKKIFFVAVSLFVLAGCTGASSGYKAPMPESLAIVAGSGGVNTPISGGNKPLALIYKGLGSCSADQGDAGTPAYGCSEASSDAAVKAGFDYLFVGPNDSPDFSKAAVWIQPGGNSDAANAAMSSKLKNDLIQYVSNGGGYVGICAGAFLAADWFHIFPGTADLYTYNAIQSNVDYAFLKINWSGTERYIYFEGGPYFHNLGSSVEVMATFDDTGDVAAARATYGKGRVYVSGAHPEAPALWSSEDGNTDPDGSDISLAAGMISWAGHR